MYPIHSERGDLIRELICPFSCLSAFAVQIFLCSEAVSTLTLAVGTIHKPAQHLVIVAFCFEDLGQDIWKSLNGVSHETESLAFWVTVLSVKS